MKQVNIIFDEFYDSKPYWNMCDIPYHKREDENLKPKNFGWWYVDIEEIFKLNNDNISNDIEIKIVRFDEMNWNDSNCVNVYPIFTSDRLSHVPKMIEWIPKVILDKANNGKLKIVIINYFEADYSASADYYWNIRNICKLMNLKMNSIQVWTNNFYNGDNLKPMNTGRTDLEDLSHYIVHGWESYNIDRLKSNEVDIDQTFSCDNKNKIFLFQNGTPRSWRYLAYKMLEYKKVTDKGLISYLPTTAHRPHNYDLTYDHADHQIYQKFTGGAEPMLREQLNECYPDILPYIYENPRIESITLPNCKINPSNFIDTAAIVNQEWLNDTYFSLIAESQFTKTTGIISEKTFKMIYYGHPFIIIGAPGTLKELRRIGYQTFPELFDESYDDMEIGVEKIKFIIDQVVNWCLPQNKQLLIEKFKSVKHTVEHNRKVFLSKNHHEKWLRLE